MVHDKNMVDNFPWLQLRALAMWGRYCSCTMYIRDMYNLVLGIYECI